MKNALISLIACGLLLSGCSETAESEVRETTKLVSNEKDRLSSENEGIATSILSQTGKLVKEAHKLEELEEILGSPDSKEGEKWLYQDDFGTYTFEGNSEIIDSIKIELKNPKQLQYQNAFDLLGLDIGLGEEIDSEDYGAEGFIKYKVIGNDAESVLIEKFSGTGGSSLSVSIDEVFEEGNGSIWLDCDEDGNVVYIEMMNSNEYEDEDLEIEEAENQNIFTGEINVYSLIDNDVRIGDDAEEISKVNSEQYKEEFGEYLFSLSNDLYGHISTNIINSLTVRLDNNPVSMDEADDIIDSILPEDAVLQDSRTESPYIFYSYTSASIPNLSTLVVQVGVMGDMVKVIGFDADIGTTIYFNH